MLGGMQNWSLLIGKFLDYAATNHPRVEVVSKMVEGGIHRYTYADMHLRTRKLAQALSRLGLRQGDCVGTLAWNTYRHVETWYAAAGIGGIYHTINPRLFPEQIEYIINHGDDKLLFLDLTFLPLVEALKDKLPNIKNYIIMTDRAHMPESSLPNMLCYEDLIDNEDGEYSWLEVDENSACGLCYTSGTTGNPKGVLFSHRSNYLHTMVVIAKNSLEIGANDSYMPIVPMFHANAWGIPFATAGTGAKLVLNGSCHDPEELQQYIIDEEVTGTAAVPTVWTGMLAYLKKSGKNLGKLTNVTIGGSAAPPSMIKAFQEDYGVTVKHAWGMTETSPLGTVGTLTRETISFSKEKWLEVQSKQGRVLPGIEMRIVNDNGILQPRDGSSSGHLQVKGPWVVDRYFKDEKSALNDDGWFDSGDIATIDEMGFMQITDRAKDVIKSGGEWISSIDLENVAVGHPDILEAAVIGMAHEKWGERPLLIVVTMEGQNLKKKEVLDFLDHKIVKWWMPDDVVFVTEIPHTASGKISKKTLREQFKDYKFSLE